MYENISKNKILQNNEPSIIMQYACLFKLRYKLFIVYRSARIYVFILYVGTYNISKRFTNHNDKYILL